MKSRLRTEQSIQGFTLLEVLFATTIFSIIIGGITLFGVRTMEAHMKSRAMQNAIDNARYAIEGISKKVRTSNNITTNGMLVGGTTEDYPDGSADLFVIDNVDGGRYCYRFLRINNRDGLYVMKDPTNTATNCLQVIVSGAQNVLLAGDETNGKIQVTGRFLAKKTDEASNQRGLVTITMHVKYMESSAARVSEQDAVKIQTTVSLRDF